MTPSDSPPTAASSTRSGSASAAMRAAELRRFARHEQAETFAPILATDAAWLLSEQWRSTQEASTKASTYTRHREAERATAAYFESVLYPAFPHRRCRRRLENGELEDGRPEYLVIAEKLRNCRLEGVFGRSREGGLVVAWDQKCGLVRLCPDESQNEGQRLREAYEPSLLALVRAGCRIHSGVLTLPNYPAGRLREGKRHIFKRFRDKVLRAKRDGKKRFPIRGALVVQEDPLSARGDWNIHLNVILVCDAYLDYQDLRAAWGCNLEIRRHPPNYSDGALAKLWNETVKYAVRTVPEKSAEHAERGKTDAPAFTQWPAELADEWYQAGKGFRRSRNYGELRAVDAEIRDAAAELASRGIEWLGRLTWTGAGYRISWREPLDLIRADNSTTPSDAKGRNFATGPPH